ncbi:hypothetical protein Pyrfu_0619 [Pyrolobus fumarii 1A]|uniref:Uncharacterized protein n=1 Tax=Pyrolobus fumarii (strain DSM 11204 / 1A) TaxID=694429 RepID=G0EH38_PYRF1|nr:hypothetical protein Pyrfu_0619 [Pyrolobus fumarii 1A]
MRYVVWEAGIPPATAIGCVAVPLVIPVLLRGSRQ